jgi:hypothetical protein
MPSGNYSNQSCDPNAAPMVAVVPGRTRDPFSMESCEFYALGHSGANCPINARHTRPAIADSCNGYGRASWKKSYAGWLRSYMLTENSS